MSRDKQNIKTTDWLTRGYSEEELSRMKEEAIKEAEAELRNKRIEEMCAIMADASYADCQSTPLVPESAGICDKVDCHRCKEARRLMSAGYRKASEVAREVIEEAIELARHSADEAKVRADKEANVLLRAELRGRQIGANRGKSYAI